MGQWHMAMSGTTNHLTDIPQIDQPVLLPDLHPKLEAVAPPSIVDCNLATTLS